MRTIVSWLVQIPEDLGNGDHFATPSIILKREMGVGVALVAVEDTEQDGADDVVCAGTMVASVVQRVFA